ncbi:FxSxx-COOH system tetratricopeptide repeat protein [Streptomyces sp. NPDC017524]|uniref:FxSxx-COOH system tetratricopeptide repeat protein n=1 Tax=Streptomyces sp. NPDC017524 TaxID=3364999 RepID=UPI0037A38D57
MTASGAHHASGARSIAADALSGFTNTGDHVSVTVLTQQDLHSAKEVGAPPHLWNLPYPPDRAFVGRDVQLTQLQELFRPHEGVEQTRSHVVHGMGGIGKSTLAVHYAHRNREHYGLIWWINADSPAQIDASLAALTAHLHPQWAAGVGVEARAAWASVWLQWHPGWLLIFDNVDEPRDAEPYLGGLTGGHHLLTSRRAHGWSSARAVGLDVLDDTSAADLLHELACDGSPDRHSPQYADARALATALGNLPLALHQTGAYLRQTGATLVSFYNDLGLMLDEAASGIDPERTIARVWNVTLAAVEEQSDAAITLLYALAWLSPDDCPRGLLAPLCPDGRTLNKALGVLATYNLVHLTGPAVRIHRLLQLTLRRTPDPAGLSLTSLPTARGRAEATRVLRHALHPEGAASPAPQATWDLCLPHLLVLVSTVPDGYDDTAALPLYLDAAERLHEQRLDDAALPLWEGITREYEATFPPDTPEALHARHRMAAALMASEESHRALSLLDGVVADRTRLLGADHPDTLESLHDLGCCHIYEGDVPSGEAMLARAAQGRERVLGRSHPQTLKSRGYLATCYAMQQRPDKAVSLLEQVVAESAHVQGPDHLDTLECRDLLATCLGVTSRIDEAVRLREDLVADCERALGGDDPHTLSARTSLSGYYSLAGRTQDAIALQERVVRDHERVFGTVHPDTVTARITLADEYRDGGQKEAAVTLLEVAVADCVRHLGTDHPHTLRARTRLAACLVEADREAEAVRLGEELVADYERVFGADHHQSLESRSGLADVYRKAGSLEKAISLHEQVVAHRTRVLGVTDFFTLMAKSHLALAYFEAQRFDDVVDIGESVTAALGDAHLATSFLRYALTFSYAELGNMDEAIAQGGQALADFEHIQGADHPDVLLLRRLLSDCYWEAGQKENAIELMEQLLADSERVLGPDHPDTVQVREDLREREV